MSSRLFGLTVLLMQPLVGLALLRAEDKPATQVKLIQRTYMVADLIYPLKPAAFGPGILFETGEKPLIKLITGMVAPETWNSKGGAGTIDYFPLGVTLVINQTPEVHKRIAALLKTLRAKQETEVACEVRIISMEADFGRRLFHEFGIPTKDGTAVTFFSDEQLHKFFEASQGDLGTNVLQTPRITMLNGQDVTLRVTNMQFFATSVHLHWDGEKVFGMPINEGIETGIVMSVQPLIAADGHSVQLHFFANLRSLESQKVGLSPVTTEIMPVHKPDEEAKPVVFTQFIQTPKVITLSVDKVLSIPEGHTAVLSGWKRKREVTKTWALPLLSELPYLGPLYRCEWQEPVWERILFMVTPKVVLPEKAESYERIHGGIE